MNVRQLFCVACAPLLALPLYAGAEVYKWKDKNGVVRYSDTPPPSNIKQELIGRKKAVKPTNQAPLAPVNNGNAAAVPVVAKPTTEGPSAEDEAAEQRQRNAEIEKKNKEEKEKQDKVKAENCNIAKGNMANYKRGGRITRTNENGEREYIDDKGRVEGMERAQQDIDENCN